MCGAPNVAAGQTVAVALPGAVMPDGTRLKRSKLRGVVSEGMILAEDEVAIGTDHDGIMVLDDDLLEGTPLAEVLPIATDVLELEITPNRPGLPVDLRRRARGPRRHRRAAEPAAVARRPRHAPATSPACGSRSRRPTCARASPRGCSRTSSSARRPRG